MPVFVADFLGNVSTILHIIRIYMYIYIYTHTCVCIHIHMHASIHPCMQKLACNYIRMHGLRYIDIHNCMILYDWHQTHLLQTEFYGLLNVCHTVWFGIKSWQVLIHCNV